MTIHSYLDDMIISVRKGIELYHFGDGCIADYYSNSIGYLDDLDIEILNICGRGDKKLKIVDEAARKLKVSPETIENSIDNMLKIGVLSCCDCGNESKLVFHGEKGAFYPKEIAIELTNTCNYMCPFCYKNATRAGEFISDDTILELNRIISNRVYNILLTGGEPTIHPHYLDYILMFSEYARVHMISNGSIIFEHDPSVLKRLDVLQFSIYGCSNQEYQKMTGAQDGFTRLCKAVEFAQSNNIYIKMAVTLCDETMDHIESFVQTAVNFGVDSIRIGIADYFGRGSYLFSDPEQYEQKRLEALNQVVELKRIYRKRIKIEVPNINPSHVNKHADLQKCIYRGSLQCGCGSEYIVVSEGGYIRPCQMLPESWFALGNIEALAEHIKGNFHLKGLSRAIQQYYKTNRFHDRSFSPCEALECFESLEE